MGSVIHIPLLWKVRTIMFLYRRKPTEAEQLMEQMKENDYKLEIARRDREISMLQLQLAVKECMLAAKELREVTESWRN